MITAFYHADILEPGGSGTLILLAVDIDAQQACIDYNSGFQNTYYINNPDFLSATQLAFNSDLSTPALPGWYSDGNLSRNWNGSSFTSEELCLLF